jgi:hypothetical protein
MGELSLWAAGALGSACWHGLSESMAVTSGKGDPSQLLGSRSSEVCLSECGLQEGSIVVLLTQGIQAFGQQEPWGLLAGTNYQEA